MIAAVKTYWFAENRRNGSATSTVKSDIRRADGPDDPDRPNSGSKRFNSHFRERQELLKEKDRQVVPECRHHGPGIMSETCRRRRRPD